MHAHAAAAASMCCASCHTVSPYNGVNLVLPSLNCCLQVFHDQVVQFTDAGAAAGNAVVTFDTLSLVAPRGRFDVEMYMSSLKLTGQVSPVCQYL